MQHAYSQAQLASLASLGMSMGSLASKISRRASLPSVMFNTIGVSRDSHESSKVPSIIDRGTDLGLDTSALLSRSPIPLWCLILTLSSSSQPSDISLFPSQNARKIGCSSLGQCSVSGIILLCVETKAILPVIVSKCLGFVPLRSSLELFLLIRI